MPPYRAVGRVGGDVVNVNNLVIYLKRAHGKHRDPGRERAVEEADAPLTAGGYAAMSLEAVAQVIGIRKPGLYYHFPRGKDELFIAVVERRTALDGAPGGADPALPRPDRHGGHLPEQHRDFVRRLIDERVMGPVCGFSAEGVARGELRPCDPQLAALGFVMLMASMGKIGNADPRRKALPDLIIDVFADGLRGGTTVRRATAARC